MIYENDLERSSRLSSLTRTADPQPAADPSARLSNAGGKRPSEASLGRLRTTSRSSCVILLDAGPCQAPGSPSGSLAPHSSVLSLLAWSLILLACLLRSYVPGAAANSLESSSIGLIKPLIRSAIDRLHLTHRSSVDGGGSLTSSSSSSGKSSAKASSRARVSAASSENLSDVGGSSGAAPSFSSSDSFEPPLSSASAARGSDAHAPEVEEGEEAAIGFRAYNCESTS